VDGDSGAARRCGVRPASNDNTVGGSRHASYPDKTMR